MKLFGVHAVLAGLCSLMIHGNRGGWRERECEQVKYLAGMFDPGQIQGNQFHTGVQSY